MSTYFSALLTSLEPDVTIRILPDATRTTYSSNAKNGAEKGTKAGLRADDVQMAHVAVFATACNARPRTHNEAADTNIDDMDDTFLNFQVPNDDGDDGKSCDKIIYRNLCIENDMWSNA